MHGCCVDKKYGKGCTEETCMQLPEGKTCGDCVHIHRCKAMFGHVETDTSCDWFPRRFTAAAMADKAGLERVLEVVQNYAPHHGELRANDRAWYAMDAICSALGIETRYDDAEPELTEVVAPAKKPRKKASKKKETPCSNG